MTKKELEKRVRELEDEVGFLRIELSKKQVPLFPVPAYPGVGQEPQYLGTLNPWNPTYVWS